MTPESLARAIAARFVSQPWAEMHPLAQKYWLDIARAALEALNAR